MAAPHPQLARARRLVAESWARAGIGAGDRVLLAVSGGSDSMALALAASYTARREGVVLEALVVDHGWRPESLAEARVAVDRLGLLGVTASVVSVDCDGSGGPEAAARDARYAALAGRARELGAAIMLGHTANDQAETVLLGLGRGSGSRSLAGMAEVSECPGAPDVVCIRPFLAMRREDLRDALRSEGVSWSEDPTNFPGDSVAESPLRRVAVRHGALPALRDALGPGVVEALGRTASMLRDDADALDSWASAVASELAGVPGDAESTAGARPEPAARELEVAETGPVHTETDVLREPAASAEALQVDTRELARLPRAVRTRVVRRLAIQAGARAGELTWKHVDTLDSWVTTKGEKRHLDLPGATARVQGGRLVLTTARRTVGKVHDAS